MKNIDTLLKSWDELDERIRMLVWAQKTFLKPKLIDEIARLSEDCGLWDASPATREFWVGIQSSLSLRENAELLLHLRSLGALIEDFVAAFQMPEGGTVDRALSLLNPRAKKSSFPVLPTDWRN